VPFSGSRRTAVFAIGGVLLGVGLSKLLGGKKVDPARIAAPHLDKAEKDTETIIRKGFPALWEFFSAAKKNTPKFAEEVLGYASKWRLVVDYVPFTKGDRHAIFIKSKFEQFIFSPDQLKIAVENTIKGYLDEIQSIESRMLVDLRADIANYPDEFPIGQYDEGLFQEKFDQALALAANASGSDLSDGIATGIVSAIAGEVMTLVAVRLGVSGGIIASGGASSWATLGIGLIVGLIVDQIVGWVWNWWADPKGNLAQDLNSKLDELYRHIADSIREQLAKFQQERDIARRKAVVKFLKTPKEK
jgi:hypothetical protein